MAEAQPGSVGWLLEPGEDSVAHLGQWSSSVPCRDRGMGMSPCTWQPALPVLPPLAGDISYL